ncbi:hypothetical protein SSAG_06399 [Streptomyces sp. Mg1]|nr:hypothetical protein SSAG_06399 [Streptomyces sp. Mg1]
MDRLCRESRRRVKNGEGPGMAAPRSVAAQIWTVASQGRIPSTQEKANHSSTTTGRAMTEVAGPVGEAYHAVAPGDPGALTIALGRVLGDPELRARLGAAGRERVLDRFTWARAAEGTAAHYRAAIERAARARSDR